LANRQSVLILRSGPGVTGTSGKDVHHSGHNEGTANTTGPVRVVEAPTDNVSLLPMEEGGA